MNADIWPFLLVVLHNILLAWSKIIWISIYIRLTLNLIRNNHLFFLYILLDGSYNNYIVLYVHERTQKMLLGTYITCIIYRYAWYILYNIRFYTKKKKSSSSRSLFHDRLVHHYIIIIIWKYIFIYKKKKHLHTHTQTSVHDKL